MNYEQTIKMLQKAIKYADNAEERAMYISELALMDKRKMLDHCDDYGYAIIPVEIVSDMATISVYDLYSELYIKNDHKEPSVDELCNVINKISTVYVMPEDIFDVYDYISALHRSNVGDCAHNYDGRLPGVNEPADTKTPAKDYDTLSSAVAYLHNYMDCNRESMDADDLGHLAVTLKNLVTMMTESL